MATATKTAPKKTPMPKVAAPAKKAAAKQPAPVKAAAEKKAPAAKAPVKKAAAAAKSAPPTRKAGTPGRAAVTPEQRLNYVEVAAYFIAERNGFVPGCELENWAAAEAEIDRLLAAGLLNP